MNGLSQALPLTASQKRIWFTQQLGLATVDFTVSGYADVTGEIDADTLLQAVRRVFAESKALQCNFVDTPLGPRQFVTDREFCIERVSFEDEVDPEKSARAYLDDRRRRQFDIDAEPLVRTALLRLSAHRHIIFLQAHHLVIDGFGAGVMFQRLKGHYRHLIGEGDAPAPVPPFESLVQDDLDYQNSGRLDLDRRYWLDALAGATPAARSRAAAHGHRFFAPSRGLVTPAVTAALQGQSTSLSGVILAGMAAHVARTFGTDRARIGVVTHARDSSLIRRIPGNAYNILPVDLAVAPGTTFEELVEAAFQQMKGALRHQRYRAEDVARDLRIPLENLFDCIINVLPPAGADQVGSATWTLYVLSAGPPADSYVTLQTTQDGGLEVHSGEQDASDDPGSFCSGAADFVDHLGRAAQDPTQVVDLACRLPKTPRSNEAMTAVPEASLPTASRRRPRTGTEQMLGEVLGQILGIATVSPDDTLTGLGVSSLSALMVISRVRTLFGTELTVRDVLRDQSVAELARRLDRAGDGVQLPSLRRMQWTDDVPVSGSQRTILRFQARYGETGGVDNVPVGLRLRGELDVATLRAALEDVVARHQPLRTLFRMEKPFTQRVLAPDEASLPVEFVDVADEADLQARLQLARTHSFDLTTQVPMHATVFRMGPDDHLLLMMFHHIAVDALSGEPLLNDFVSAFAARSAGGAPAWEPLPIEFTDFALWEHDMLGDPSDPGSISGTQLRFWLAALKGAPEEVALPSDRPRPPVPSFRASSVALEIDSSLHRGIERLAESSGVTVFMILQAALAVLLTRSGAGTDIVIGSPVAGRSHSQLDCLVGCFINAVALRTDTAGNPTYEELLLRVRDFDLEAFSHQQLPFYDLADALGAADSYRRHPVFQTYLAFDDFGDAGPSRFPLGGLDAEVIRVVQGITIYDNVFWLRSYRDDSGSFAGMSGRLFFACDLFDEETVQRNAGRFVRILQSMVHHPASRILEES